MRLETSFIEQQRAFLTQYTAVFLLILTFVVGAFAKPPVAKNELPLPRQALSGTGSLPPIEGPLRETDALAIGALKIEDAFDQESNNLKTDQLDGVVAALRSHDIGVRFSIAVPTAKEGDDNGVLVARMVSSYRWLESLGLPERAYLVEGVTAGEADSSALTVEFVGGIHE